MENKIGNYFLFIILVIFFLSGSAMSFNISAETGKKPDPNRILKGKKLFMTFCQSCHGHQGVGEPIVPWSIRDPSYVSAPALDDSQHAWHHTDEALINIILEGPRNTKRMPAWKNILSTDDARNLVDFMKSLWSVKALECQGPKHMSCK